MVATVKKKEVFYTGELISLPQENKAMTTNTASPKLPEFNSLFKREEENGTWGLCVENIGFPFIKFSISQVLAKHLDCFMD